MIRSIKLNGRQRTVLLGNLAYKWLKEETDLTLKEVGLALESQDISISSTLLYYGLRAGERHDKVQEPEEYSADDVALWMDLEPGSLGNVIPWIIESISDMTGLELNDKGEAVAKKKTLRPPKK
jgi:hypothetical protein